MGRGIALAGIIIIVIGVIAGGVMLANMAPTQDNTSATMICDFSAIDVLAGSQDATTSAVGIYRMIDSDIVLQETVTMDALSKASGITYTTGEILYLKLYDATDTSVCTQYQKLVVPPADPAAIYDGAFQIKLDFVDKGDTAKDILLRWHNGTAITATTTVVDVTSESFNTNYMEWNFEARALNDDSGYVNTYNFLKGYGNNHYLVIKASGTGWDSVNLLSGGWNSFDKASARYFVLPLDNNDLTRDLQATGEYNPTGFLAKSMVFDLTGFASGDNVTINYEYRWYSCWDHFQDTSAWGADSAATTETIYIQY